MKDKGTIGVGELLVLSPPRVACLLACVFFHLLVWDCDRDWPWISNPPPHGEATPLLGESFGGGGPARFPGNENGAIVSCSHLLMASSGVRGSGKGGKSESKGLQRGPIYSDRRASSPRVNPTPVNPV